MNRIFITILITGFCLGLLSQDSTNQKSFDEKIKELEKKNVYWSTIKGDDKKISKDKKENLLAEYRNKMMKILGKTNEEWGIHDEFLISRMFYHKVNINKYKEIEKAFDATFKDLFDRNLNSQFFWYAQCADVIFLGRIIEKSGLTADEKKIYSSFWEYKYRIRTDEILYSDNFYFNSVRNEVIMLGNSITTTEESDYVIKNRSENRDGIFFCTQFYEERMINRYDDDKYHGNKNVFPISHCYNKDDSLITILKEFIKLNDYENFYKRSYK